MNARRLWGPKLTSNRVLSLIVRALQLFFLELTAAKIDQSFKEDVLGIMDDSESLQPIGDLKKYKSQSKTLGYLLILFLL